MHTRYFKSGPLLLFFAFLIPLGGWSQNLVPNGGFEDITCPTNIINSIFDTETWDAINSDAYWIHEQCPISDEIVEALPFFDEAYLPFQGQGFITMEGAFTVNGYYVSEGVTIELKEPLKPGGLYFFAMAAKQLDLFQLEGHPPNFCDLPQDRFLTVQVAPEPVSIAMLRDGLGVPSELTSNATEVLIDSTSLEEEFEPKEWYQYSDCFTAPDASSHLAVAGNFYYRPDQNNCYEEGSRAALFSHGFSIDEIELYEVPFEIDTFAPICEVGSVVDARLYIDLFLRNNGEFRWADGCTDLQRIIRSPGVYEAELALPCYTIPIRIEARIAEDCNPAVYSDEFPEEVRQAVSICTDFENPPITLEFLVPDSLRPSAQYTWSDGGTEVQRVLNNPGLVEVQVQATCFDFPIRLEVQEEICGVELYSPTAFSPNADGANDRFELFPVSSREIETYQLRIFDRWGSLVFATLDPDQAWDGNYRGRSSAAGVYTWILEVLLREDDSGRDLQNTFQYSGEVTLIR